jgi:hypothetical protein
LAIGAVDELLAVRPELRIDGTLPDRDELAARLVQLWLVDEVAVYIGLAGTSLRKRVGDYYRTPLGARRPHAGGWPLKTLSVLPELTVHWASCLDPGTAELQLLDHFIAGVSQAARPKLADSDLPIPFANLERAKGQAKKHGITGAREPSSARTRTTPPARSPEPASPRAPPTPSRQLVTPAGPMRSQRVTEKDIQAGRIRFPSSAKRAFPPERSDAVVELRGVRLMARWHPHYDRDQERSGVLSVGRDLLGGRVVPDEVLAVEPGDVVVLR